MSVSLRRSKRLVLTMAREIKCFLKQRLFPRNRLLYLAELQFSWRMDSILLKSPLFAQHCRVREPALSLLVLVVHRSNPLQTTTVLVPTLVGSLDGPPYSMR